MAKRRKLRKPVPKINMTNVQTAINHAFYIADEYGFNIKDLLPHEIQLVKEAYEIFYGLNEPELRAVQVELEKVYD